MTQTRSSRSIPRHATSAHPHPRRRTASGRRRTATSDLWIELLHALGLDPVAALPFTLAIDFEGDQWTFFKFPLADLYDLYGLDVQELAIWRPLVDHVEEQVDAGAACRWWRWTRSTCPTPPARPTGPRT